MPQAFLTPNASLGRSTFHNKPSKKPIFQWVLNLARWEGAVANTYPQHLEITDTLIQSLIDLAHSLRRLGVRDIDGKLTYEEGELC